MFIFFQTSECNCGGLINLPNHLPSRLFPVSSVFFRLFFPSSSRVPRFVLHRASAPSFCSRYIFSSPLLVQLAVQGRNLLETSFLSTSSPLRLPFTLFLRSFLRLRFRSSRPSFSSLEYFLPISSSCALVLLVLLIFRIPTVSRNFPYIFVSVLTVSFFPELFPTPCCASFRCSNQSNFPFIPSIFMFDTSFLE